jgi:hypothetical protein
LVDRTINLFWPDMAIRLLSYWCGGGGGRAAAMAALAAEQMLGH